MSLFACICHMMGHKKCYPQVKRNGNVGLVGQYFLTTSAVPICNVKLTSFVKVKTTITKLSSYTIYKSKHYIVRSPMHYSKRQYDYSLELP